MTRLQEINKRMLEIRALLEGNGEVDLNALESELRALDAEKKNLEKRAQIASSINAGSLSGTPINPPVAAPEQRDFSGLTKEELYATPEYRSAFLKHLLGKPMTETEQRAYDSTTTAVIPQQTSDQLFVKMTKIAPMLNEITLLRVAGQVKFAIEGTRSDAIQHTENAEIDAAEDTLVYVTLAGFDYTKLIRISKTISTMAINAFEGWLTDMLAEDIAIKLEDVIINGTGSGQPKGVAHAADWGENNSVAFTKGGSPTYDNIVELISKLPARYASNAKFLCNNAFLYGYLAKIKDENKQPILVRDMTGGMPLRILGFPVLVSDKVEAKTMY